MFGLNEKEVKLFRSLNTPRKIQKFLNEIPINFEKNGDTCFSPRCVLKEQKAHCIEGAMVAAVALRFHGYKPLIVDMTASKDDDDHVIAVFKQSGYWGAVSKTNHAVLRYRDPIYKTVRELVVSFFHEYFNDHGQKTLRSYSNPVDLSQFDDKDWMTAEKDVWYIADYLATIEHFPIVSRQQIALLKKPDPIEREVGSVVEWKGQNIQRFNVHFKP